MTGNHRADDVRFDLRYVGMDGSSVYAAPHELHNEVRITFPADYFGEVSNRTGPPSYVGIVLEVLVGWADPQDEPPMPVTYI